MGLVQDFTDHLSVFAHLITAWKATRLSECPSVVCGACPDVAVERVPVALEKGVDVLRLGYEECLERARGCHSSSGLFVLFWVGVLCGVLLTVLVGGLLYVVTRLRRRETRSTKSRDGSRNKSVGAPEEFPEETVSRYSGPVSPSLRR